VELLGFEPGGAVTCRILEEDRELAQAIPERDRDRAISACLAPVLRIPRGRWPGHAGRIADEDGIGLLVLDGLMIRRVGIDERFGAELLGTGDLLRPWQHSGAEASIDRSVSWRVLVDSRVAVLDRRVAYRMAPFQDLTAALVGRALWRARSLAVSMAIVHQPLIEARLHMLFWHLADRWGTVSRDGVRLPLRLTHAVLAELVASRRPTVTSALARLAAQGSVTYANHVWFLTGGPPGGLLTPI
jgi:CRP-like cAMP-binding protein